MYIVREEQEEGLRSVDITCNSDTLKQVDIRTVSPESLKDIKEVKVNTDLSVEKRMMEFVEQIGNPYCFRCGKLIVQVEYSDTGKTINDCLNDYFAVQTN